MYICTAAGNNIYNTKVLYIYIYVRTYVIIIIISNERRYILNLLYLFSDDFLDRQNQEFCRKFPEDPSPKMMGRVWVDDSAATPKISSWPS